MGSCPAPQVTRLLRSHHVSIQAAIRQLRIPHQACLLVDGNRLSCSRIEDPLGRMTCITVPPASASLSLPPFRVAFGSSAYQITTTEGMRYPTITNGGNVSPTNQLPSLQERLRLQNNQQEPAIQQEFIKERRPFLHQNKDLDGAPATESKRSNSVELMLSPCAESAVPAPGKSPSWSETSSTVSNQSPREAETDEKRKRPRFLGDIDRRMIIQRLKNGEKQADLAREFGVTRAAICHINKNRDEILTRFDILAKSPQGRQMIENYVRSPHFSSYVRELRTPSVLVLLTRLRDHAMTPSAFKSTADRLMSMLIEESLVAFGTKAVDVKDLFGAYYEGKEYARPVFALSSGEEGRPLLNTFAGMEPTAFRGFVHMDCDSDGALELRRLDLPKDASGSNVLLFQVALDDADRTGFVIEALKARGVLASRVCVVCFTASADVVTTFASRLRDVKVVTGAINADVDAPQLAGFVDKYQQAAST